MAKWVYRETYDDGSHHKHYGFFHFLWDAFMVIVTSGFWLIWIFVREMRKR